MRTLRFLASLFLIVFPATAAAQAKPVVAVLPFGFASTSSGVDTEALGSALTDIVMAEFGKAANIALVERTLVEDILKKQKLLLSGRVSDEEAVRAGRLLQAQYVVAGSVLMIGKESQLSVRIVDVETSGHARNAGRRGKTDELLSVAEGLLREFTTDLNLPVRALAQAQVEIPAAATLAYSRGLDYEKRGRKQQAAAMYQKALELAPGHADAKAALDRVR